MPGRVVSSRSSPGQAHKGLPSGSDYFFLLRNGHIFASTFRDALQLGPLRHVPRPLSPSQSRMLRLLCTNGPQPVGHVARILGISAPAGTRTIDALERLELVVRKSGKGDRRTTMLTPSRAGRSWVKRYERVKLARLVSALDGFSPAEVETMARLLERFSISLLRRGRGVRTACLRCNGYIEAGCPVGKARGGCPYQELSDARARAAATAPRTEPRSRR